MEMAAEYLNLGATLALVVMTIVLLKNLRVWTAHTLRLATPHRLRFFTDTEDGKDCLRLVSVLDPADKKLTKDVEVCNVGSKTIKLRLVKTESRQAFVQPNGTKTLDPNTCWQLRMKNDIGISPGQKREVTFDAVDPPRCGDGGDADMYIEC